MKRIAAFTVCLAAAWLLYGTGMELFIGWYSGAEMEFGWREWATVAIQVVVNAAAAILGWRVVRATSSRRVTS